MATKKELQNQAKSQIEARERQIKTFVQSLDRFLRLNLENILEEIESGALSGLQAAQALGGLQASLVDLGLPDVLGRLTAIYGSELKDIQEAFRTATGKTLILNELDIATTEALIRFDTNVIANSVNTYVDDLKATMMRGVITGDVPKFRDLHEKLGSRMLSGAETELNTALQGFSRSVNLAKADDAGIELFLYAGPDDEVTRPFCQERVGQVFTREEIAEWDNEQGLPADIYLGGYNCRHRLDPVSLETARQLGYDG